MYVSKDETEIDIYRFPVSIIFEYIIDEQFFFVLSNFKNLSELFQIGTVASRFISTPLVRFISPPQKRYAEKRK